MQFKDIRKLFLGLNQDDDPSLIQQGEYVEGMNVRVASSNQQHGKGVMETLQGEVEILLGVAAPITYYGESIGGEFIYTGYDEVQIGTQVWMKKNWDYNYPGSKVYNDTEANRTIYGGLYTWNQAMAADFCPPGWHVPTEAEIDTLLTYLGGVLIAGGKMKEPDTLHWLTPNTGADDSSGFKGLPGGKYDSTFSLLAEMGLFWLADETAPVLDADGNEYTSIIIGHQEWLIENLKTTKYADGTPIPNLTLNAQWIADGVGAYCWYDNDIAYKTPYGALYNWYAVSNAHGLAPTGWRIATETDWNTLISYLGGTAIAGGKLKEMGLTHWITPNTGATNSSGFTALGTGIREWSSGVFMTINTSSYLWCYNINKALTLSSNLEMAIIIGAISQNWGGTVRCMRDI